RASGPATGILEGMAKSAEPRPPRPARGASTPATPAEVHEDDLRALEAARERADALRIQIRDHDYRYYVLDQPVIGDSQYDALMRELRALEEEFPELLSPDSPTQRVAGQAAEGFAVVEHREP